MNLQEDYCSFEVAKLLKEKGFDGLCYTYYPRGVKDKYNISMLADNHNKHSETSRPTLQMAMKWLREVHRKYIDIRYNNQNEEYRFIVFTMVKDKPIDFMHSEYHSTYEEAVEAALKYVLENLI